jgi:N6-L-threonylcarbamoyladenine synthase
MRVLGIESSCDDTACAVVEDGRRILAAERLSSARLQQRFGGVVPEVAAREHTMAILPVVQAALETCGCKPVDLDVIAVTQGPGLVGALLVGVTFAKALGQAIDRPVVGVHHLEAHLYANALVAPIQFPALALIVSGGHTSLVYWEDHGRLTMLGQTRDDAAGEALDKGARLLGLGYPGGPEIERLAATVSHEPPFRLPVAKIAGDSLDFSFSGLKTATADRIREHADAAAEVAKALQEAVVEALCRNLDRAWRRVPVEHVYLAGGVTANQRLAECVRGWGAGVGVAVHVPPVEYCTDNGAMVGACGFYQFRLGARLPLGQGPRTPWVLGT